MTYKKYPNKKRRYPFKRVLKRRLRKIAFMLVAGIIASGINYYNNHSSKSVIEKTQTTKIPSGQIVSDANSSTDPKTLHKLYQARKNSQSKIWVTVNGKVIKTLKDDLVGSRHQKFLIKIADDFTLLISHNIDLAPRVPIHQGSPDSVSGLYEWNNRGGLIHWTHRDPKGNKKGGWIKVKGKKYR